MDRAIRPRVPSTQINIATGALMQTIQTHEGLLFGLSVAGEIDVATTPTTVPATPSTLDIQPVAGQLLLADAGLGRPD